MLAKAIFHRSKTKNSKIYMVYRLQKTPNSQSNAEKKEQSWSYHLLRLQTVLHIYSNQNNNDTDTNSDT